MKRRSLGMIPVIYMEFDEEKPGERPTIFIEPDWDDPVQNHYFTCLQRWQDIGYNINIPESKLK